jgi:alpha/beta superfamily hydrolase
LGRFGTAGREALIRRVSRRIETIFIPGPAGRLEALLEEPEQGEAYEAALVCHPHPRHGGTMHNKVVYRMARALRSTGAVVLRFNFRGVNLSEGEYDRGAGEVDDARAALDWLRERYPHRPYTLAGFSFGSRVIQRLGCKTRLARRLIVAGFPTVRSSLDDFLECHTRRIFVQSTRDEYGPRPDLEAFFEKARGPRELHFIEARDHFFAGALDAFERLLRELK